MSAEMAQFLVDVKFDSGMFSLNATTSEMLQKVCGIKRLNLLHQAVEPLITARGQKPRLRISVSTTHQDASCQERDASVQFRTQGADVVRVGEIYEHGRFSGFIVTGDPSKKLPETGCAS
jgi:hypothetical protein